jgi:hypothetical protein
VVTRLFFRVNGVVLKFDPVESVALMVGVAGGKFAERVLVGWFRGRIVAE